MKDVMVGGQTELQIGKTFVSRRQELDPSLTNLI